MTLPPVVSDPEGPCPGRLVLASDPEPFTRHDFSAWTPVDEHHNQYKVCCWCGGRCDLV